MPIDAALDYINVESSSIMSNGQTSGHKCECKCCDH